MVKIYEDRYCIISMEEKCAVKGDVNITFKQEYKSSEDAPVEEFIHGITLAKFSASILFELLQGQGTNIVMNENPLMFKVLVRRNKDGLNLKWNPKQIDPAQFLDAFNRIKDEAFFIGKDKGEEKHAEKAPKNKEKTDLADREEKHSNEDSIEFEEEKENYRVKQLTRVP